MFNNLKNLAKNFSKKLESSDDEEIDYVKEMKIYTYIKNWNYSYKLNLDELYKIHDVDSKVNFLKNLFDCILLSMEPKVYEMYLLIYQKAKVNIDRSTIISDDNLINEFFIVENNILLSSINSNQLNILYALYVDKYNLFDKV